MYVHREDGKSVVRAARAGLEMCLTTDIAERNMVKFINRDIKCDGISLQVENAQTSEERSSTIAIDNLDTNSLILKAVLSLARNTQNVPISHYELDNLNIKAQILSDKRRINPRTISGLARSLKRNECLLLEYGFNKKVISHYRNKYAVRESERVIRKALGELCNPPHNLSKVTISKFTMNGFREATPNGEILEDTYLMP